MKRTLRRGTIAVACGVMLALAGGTPAMAKPMKPAQIKQFVFKKAATYNNKNDMHPIRVILTQDKLDLEGRCNPKNKWNPGLRVWKNLPDRRVSVSCAGRKVVTPWSDAELGIYRIPAITLGRKIAKAAGFANEMVGETRVIFATNRKAIIWFSRTGSSVTPFVSRIIFRAAGRPIVSTSR